MSGNQGYAQAARGEHHHNLPGVGQVCEEFSVTGEWNPGLIDDALVYRGGNHAREVPVDTALGSPGQGLQDKPGVGFVQCAGNYLRFQRGIPHIQAACRGWLIRPVVRAHRQQVDSHAQLHGPLKEQVVAGNGNQGVRLAL